MANPSDDSFREWSPTDWDECNFDFSPAEAADLQALVTDTQVLAQAQMKRTKLLGCKFDEARLREDFEILRQIKYRSLLSKNIEYNFAHQIHYIWFDIGRLDKSTNSIEWRYIDLLSQINEQKTPETSVKPEIDTNVVRLDFGDYNSSMARLESAYRLVAEDLGLRVEDLRKLDVRAVEEAPQHAAPRLLWNKDNGPDENPAQFAWRAYAAEAKAGTLHLGVIRQEDDALAVKLVSWLRTPANKKQVPEGFDIPTKPEWITRQAEAGKARPSLAPPTEGQRIYKALAQRRWRTRRTQDPSL